MTFRVGQEVVCVDDGTRPDWVPPGFIGDGILDGLKKGQIYTVRGLVSGFMGYEGPCIYLAEIIRPVRYSHIEDEPPFASARFRPLVKTDISVFTSMLNPAPQHNREKADA